MKKYLAPIAIILLVVSFLLFKNYTSNRIEVPVTNQQTGYESRVTLLIDYGNKTVKSFDFIATSNDTAFSALKSVAEKEKINLETKQYDFGIFIKKIDKFESTAKNSWIYYVNGESGQVGADQYKLKNGDKIEWKFEAVK